MKPGRVSDSEFRSSTHVRAFRLAVLLAIVAAVLMVGSRVLEPLGWLTIPVTWPGFSILGADETQERYGYWGELVLFWLCSLPCIAAYSWLISFARKPKVVYE